jgi:secretion/DNA translocation related CpaE-like protein
MSRRPLLVTEDEDTLEDLLRLAIAAGVEFTVARDGIDAQRSWNAATLVFVDAEVGLGCVRVRLPRRPGVVLITRGDPPEQVPVIGVAQNGLPALQVVPQNLEPPPVDDDREAHEELWRLAMELGAEHIVFLPAAESWIIDRLGDVTPARRGFGRVVGVIGGRGGAGASVLAAALAVTAARQGMRPLLVDADPLGGGLDLVVGRERAGGVRWPDLAGTEGRISATAFLDALPRIGELCVLSWDRGELLTVPPHAMQAAIDAGRRGADLVVVDLPRCPDEAAVHALQGADLVLLLVPAEVRACASAGRVTTMVRPHCTRLVCVVRGPSPGGLKSRDLAEALGLPLAGVLRSEPGLAGALERGEVPAMRGRGPLAEFCRRILHELDQLSAAA